jgi:hypothetical protein
MLKACVYALPDVLHCYLVVASLFHPRDLSDTEASVSLLWPQIDEAVRVIGWPAGSCGWPSKILEGHSGVEFFRALAWPSKIG